jgi:hypothetical protein
MLVTTFSILSTELSAVRQNEPSPILVRLLDAVIAMVARLAQSTNALFPMLVTLSGIVRESKAVNLNVLSPISVTPFGIVMVATKNSAPISAYAERGAYVLCPRQEP